MAGLDETDPVLVHLNYIREDIRRLEHSFQETRKELIHVNESQWDEIASNRVELEGKIGGVDTKVGELSGKVNRQAGVNSVLSVIAACITSVLIQLGVRK